MFFKQVQQHSDNFSYIVADNNSNEAAVIDSSFNAGEIIKIPRRRDTRVERHDDADVEPVQRRERGRQASHDVRESARLCKRRDLARDVNNSHHSQASHTRDALVA